MKTEELQSIQIWDDILRKNVTIVVGQDARIFEHEHGTWGKVEKITSGWGGTIYVRTRPNCPLRKFDKVGYERTGEVYHVAHVAHVDFYTPESKQAFIDAQKEEALRLKRAYQIKAIKFEYLNKHQIWSVYEQLVLLGIIKTETVPD